MDEFKMTIPVPASKKNRQRIWRVKGKPFITMSAEAKIQQETLHDYALFLLKGEVMPFGDDDISASIRYRARRKMIDVELRRMNPRPKGFSGRQRDISNIPEVLLDALQGALYKNDNQISRLEIWKELT